jgi:DNA-binding transcriptional ArsR family regulator
MPITHERDSLTAATSLFRSLADPARLAIVRQLTSGEARVRDLVDELGLAQSTVSEHVACLRDCGLIEGRPDGRQVFYYLSRPELMDLLDTAEVLLEATGYQVDLCGTYGAQSEATK